jgi:hypothetical protein
MINLPCRVQAAALASIGVCAYIIGFCAPFEWDIPLIVLAATSVLSKPFSSRALRPPLVGPVVFFLIATALSILASRDVYRSLRLSLSFLPALLIFFLIIEHIDVRHLRLLFGTFSAGALGLAGALLWIASSNPGGEPHIWVETLGSPILLVPNDITFLATITPFSLALLLQKTPRPVKVLTTLSIVLSVLIVCLLRSRAALLTMMISVICLAAVMRPRFGLMWGGAVFVAVLLLLIIDGLLGFPMIAKHGSVWDTRIPLWLAAWQMFLDAPLLGHGPHTFILFYQSYLHDLALPDWLPVDHRVIPWAHNLYLEVLAEQGIVGFGGLGLLLTCAISTAWNAQHAAQGEVRIFAASVFASLISFCVAAALELSFLRQWVVVMLFAILGVSAQLSVYSKQQGDPNELN